MKIPDSISAIVGPIRAIRRDIHAHPELKFEENRTAEIVTSALRSFGIDEIHTGLGKTGVVGILRGRPGSKMLGLRADMDALPCGFLRISTQGGRGYHDESPELAQQLR